MLTDALATGYFGAQLGDIVEGDTVVVFGAGPVGLFAAKSAWLMGAGRVIVVDHLDYRLEKARTFAHAETHNFAEYDDIVVELKKVHRLPRGRRGHRRGGAEADGNLLQHVTSAKLKLQGGSPIALNWAIDSVAQGRHRLGDGRVRADVQRREVRRRHEQGSDDPDESVPGQTPVAAVVRAHPQRLPQPNDLITHRIPLEHIAEGFHLFSAKLDGCIKPVIVPDAG